VTNVSVFWAYYSGRANFFFDTGNYLENRFRGAKKVAMIKLFFDRCHARAIFSRGFLVISCPLTRGSRRVRRLIR
jgi:hypothetical protein